MYTMHLKLQNSWLAEVSALHALNDYAWQKKVGKKLFKYIKQITNFMKY